MYAATNLITTEATNTISTYLAQLSVSIPTPTTVRSIINDGKFLAVRALLGLDQDFLARLHRAS